MRFRLPLLLPCLLALLPVSVPSTAAAKRPPSVVLVMADDLGYADVGFHGGREIPTPHLDRLAREGVRCTNGYVSHHFCSPTRAGMLTGRYQQRFGHENNPPLAPEDARIGLPLDQVTLADALRSAGYVTGLVGKWHLGTAPPHHPQKRGFDEFFGFPHGSHHYFNPAQQGNPVMRGAEPVDEKEYLTDAFSREAVAFIERHRARPFFLFLSYNAVHTPMQAPEKYLARFSSIQDARRRTYAAMLSAMDDGIGRVLEALRRRDLERSTLVFFLSDNGGPPQANSSRNEPLRGAKGSVYEGGIRVPFLLRWKGKLKPGTFDAPVTSLDLYPTALAAAGSAPPAARKLDGVNLLPHLLGETRTPPHDLLFWRAGGGQQWAVRQGRYKLLSAGGPPQLYDLESDGAEAKDLAAEQPQVVDRLRQAYERWNGELIPPLWQNPRPGRARPVPRPAGG